MDEFEKRWQEKKAELLRLIALEEKRPGAEQAMVYPPQPTTDPIDHDKIRRDLMRRFQKTLAYLAQ
jgi:hypothetical protein